MSVKAVFRPLVVDRQLAASTRRWDCRKLLPLQAGCDRSVLQFNGSGDGKRSHYTYRVNVSSPLLIGHSGDAADVRVHGRPF